jgi:acetyl-CoA synthetase
MNHWQEISCRSINWLSRNVGSIEAKRALDGVRRKPSTRPKTPEGLMTDLFPPPQEFADNALINAAEYDAMYAASLSEPETFWGEQARATLDWIKPFSVVKNTSFDANTFGIKWFEDGVLNVSANCVDRHLATKADKTAILWEGDDPADSKAITYRQLHRQMCKMANVLKSLGVVKGDRVTLYMPMIPEAAYAMLACTRIGAIHSIVFGGFSPDTNVRASSMCS